MEGGTVMDLHESHQVLNNPRTFQDMRETVERRKTAGAQTAPYHMNIQAHTAGEEAH